MLDSPSPRPRSEAQRAAARANGARSRGPLSAAGKARASRNAFRHGLAATVHLLAPGEEPAALEALRAGLAAEYGADRPSRAILVERLAAALWKLRRAERLEAALHRLPPRPAPGWLEPDPGLPAALTRLPEYAILLRHQGQLERFLVRAIRLLEPDADRPAAAASEGDGPAAPPPEAPEPVEPAEPLPPDGPEAAAEHGPPIADATGPGATGPGATARDEASFPSEPPPLGRDAPRGPEASFGEDAAASDEAPEPDGAGPGPLAALARRSAERLLRDGRPLEAARLARLLAPPPARRGPPPGEPPPDDPAARAAAALAAAEQALDAATPEERALWAELGYESWVVPPGDGRRPLASLTAEWVSPADRWRVLEELERLGDPRERARVVEHFRRAGLDPGRDHPAFAGLVEPPPAPAGDPPAEGGPAAAGAPAAGRRALLVALGEEAEAYHAQGRARAARAAWLRHSRELGVPPPAHAGLDAAAEAAAGRAPPGEGSAAAGPAAPPPGPIRPAPG